MKRIKLKFVYIIIMVIITMAAQINCYKKISFIDKAQYLILNLPYEIDNNCFAVFDEDTPLAIDLIEIKADGKILSYIDDYETIDPRTYWNLKKTISGKTKYFISMYWKKHSLDSIIWNDGQGLIFNEVSQNLFQHKTNSYEILKGTKNVKIKYRIRLPDMLMPLKGTGILDLKENRYSKIYIISIDIGDLWK